MPMVDGLYYRVVGGGKPVIMFLHGAGGYHGVWQYYAQKLNKIGSIVLIDLPGHGKSKGIPFGTVEQSAEAISSSVIKIKKKGVIPGFPDVMVGHSLGGMVALHLALVLQNFVTVKPAVVLVSTALRLGNSGSSVNIPEKNDLCKKLFYDKEWQRRCMESRRLPIFSEFEVLKNSLMSAYKYDFRQFTHLLRASVHLIYGEKDKIIPSEYFHEVKRYLPGSKVYKIENSGHMPHLEARERVLEILLKIIEQQRNEVIA